jgi:NAD-dependent DNA ligase
MAPNGNSSNVYIVFASATLDSVHATLEAGNTRCNNAIGEGLWAVHLKVKPLLGGTVTVDAPENLVNHTQVLADAAIDYNGESSSSSKGKFEDGGSTDKVKKFLNGQGNSLRGQTFAVTGTFDTYGRKDIVQMLKNYGGDVLQELRVNMNLVVTGTHLGPKK